MFIEGTLKDYIQQAESNAPTPGGGSVSALAGALGSCMASMAANFTVGKKKFADVEEQVKEMLKTLETHREELLKCMQDDAVAFSAIGEAYGLPKESDEEKAARKEAIQAALKGAMAVPLRAMRACVGALEVMPRLAEVGNPNLVSDTGVAAILCEAALRGSELNVAINLAYIKDEAMVNEAKAEVAGLLEKAKALSAETIKVVDGKIR